MITAKTMDTPQENAANAPKRRLGRAWKTPALGMCLQCGQKLTFCGKPFSAEIPCAKCLYINIYENSQQPVSGHW
jgi:hypothetical protein